MPTRMLYNLVFGRYVLLKCIAKGSYGPQPEPPRSEAPTRGGWELF